MKKDMKKDWKSDDKKLFSYSLVAIVGIVGIVVAILGVSFANSNARADLAGQAAYSFNCIAQCPSGFYVANSTCSQVGGECVGHVFCVHQNGYNHTEGQCVKQTIGVRSSARDLSGQAGYSSSIGGSSGTTGEIECYEDSDCYPYPVAVFCLGDDQCEERTPRECINPGTPDSYCFDHDPVVECQHCPYGCEDGMCVEEPENLQFERVRVNELDVGLTGTELCLEKGYDGCVFETVKSTKKFYDTVDGTCGNIQYIDKETTTDSCTATLINTPAVCRDPGASSNYAEPYYGDSSFEDRSKYVVCYTEPTMITYGGVKEMIGDCQSIMGTAGYSCDHKCESYGLECMSSWSIVSNDVLEIFDDSLLEHKCKDMIHMHGDSPQLCICC